MKSAVCTSCGAGKLKPLTRCPKCGYQSGTSEEKAKAVLLTDRFLDDAKLSMASRQIQSGEPIEYPADVLEKLAHEFQAHVSVSEAEYNKGCMFQIVVAILVALVVISYILQHWWYGPRPM